VRVVFFGTPEWAVPSLDALLRSRHEVLRVVSQPSRRSARGAAPGPPPVARRAQDAGLPLTQPGSARDPELHAQVSADAADVAVIVAWGEIVPRALLSVPRHGFVNLHFSLLPRWRGAAPVQWAIAAGDPVTGVTTMQVSERLDAGAVYDTLREPIRDDDTAPALGARLAGLGADLLVGTLDRIEAGTAVGALQEESEATHARMLRKEDALVDWSLPAAAIARRVRAFDPWPGCETRGPKGPLRLLAVRAGGREPPDGRDAPPGTVLAIADDALRIASGEGTVLLAQRLQAPGGRPVSGREAANGRLISIGDRLGSA